MFELHDETLSYGDSPVLKALTLRIDAGERVALLGKSGSGKSTLLRHLHAMRRSEISLVPQDPGLVESLSVFHNVYMGRLDRHGALTNLRNLIWPSPREVAAVTPILARLGLESLCRTRCAELSGGQKQRTAIARAVYQESAAFLGDEPVSALDRKYARQAMGVLCETFSTLVVAMHDVAVAAEYCDRLIGIRTGEVLFDLPAKKVGESHYAALYDD